MGLFVKTLAGFVNKLYYDTVTNFKFETCFNGINDTLIYEQDSTGRGTKKSEKSSYYGHKAIVLQERFIRICH